MSQPGPCSLCGDTNYGLSYGGPGICPACDCGISTSPAEVRRLREANIALANETRGWRARYEEASLKIDRLVLECQRVDLMQSEIDDIQIMVGCNHVEGLASCVRARLEEKP